MKTKAFKEPVYVTQSLVAPLKEVTSKVKQVIQSGWLTNFGVQHNQLQKKLKTYFRCSNLDLFCNGHLALDIAIKALDLKGEVITTPFTFASTTHAIFLNGLTPIFCDINPTTYTIDPEKIEALITPKTSAILAVHVFGNPCDVTRIEKIAKKYKLKIIYDAAHAFGVTLGSTSIASQGDVSMFSFHATKVFNTVEGGCLVFKDNKLARKIYLLKNFGIENEDCVSIPGVNGKMNEIQAAIGLLNLKLVNTSIKKRKRVAQWYSQSLTNIKGLTLPSQIKNVDSNYAYYPILIDKDTFGLSRDAVYMALKKYNIFSRKYFYPLASHFDCYKHLRTARSKTLPVAEEISKKVLCLPLYANLDKKSVGKICEIIGHISNEKI